MSYTVECGGRLFGVFKSASAAASWAEKKLVKSSMWTVRPIEHMR